MEKWENYFKMKREYQSLNIRLRMCSLSSSTVSLLCFSVSISKMGISFLPVTNNL